MSSENSPRSPNPTAAATPPASDSKTTAAAAPTPPARPVGPPGGPPKLAATAPVRPPPVVAPGAKTPPPKVAAPVKQGAGLAGNAPPPGFAPLNNPASSSSPPPITNSQLAVNAALAAAASGKHVEAAAATPEQPLWPAMVPSLTDAKSILSGDMDPPDLLTEMTQQFIRALPGPHRQALMNPEGNPYGAVVAQALAIHWRISAAIAAKGQWTGKVDTALVDQIFAEVDTGIADLSTALASAEPQSQEILKAARNELASDAVNLSEALQNIVAESDTELPKYQKKVQARLTKIFDDNAPDAPREKPKLGMMIFLGVIVLAGVAFHLLNFLEDRSKANARQANAVPVSVSVPKGATAGSSRKLTVVLTKDGQPPAPDELQRMKETAAAQGKVVTEASPGVFIFAPGKLPETNSQSGSKP